MYERESLKNSNLTGDAAVNQLTAEYQRWMLGQGLDRGSPDKHVFDEALTPSQRIWLADFCLVGNAKSDNGVGLGSHQRIVGLGGPARGRWARWTATRRRGDLLDESDL